MQSIISLKVALKVALKVSLKEEYCKNLRTIFEGSFQEHFKDLMVNFVPEISTRIHSKDFTRFHQEYISRFLPGVFPVLLLEFLAKIFPKQFLSSISNVSQWFSEIPLQRFLPFFFAILLQKFYQGFLPENFSRFQLYNQISPAVPPGFFLRDFQSHPDLPENFLLRLFQKFILDTLFFLGISFRKQNRKQPEKLREKSHDNF